MCGATRVVRCVCRGLCVTGGWWSEVRWCTQVMELLIEKRSDVHATSKVRAGAEAGAVGARARECM